MLNLNKLSNNHNNHQLQFNSHFKICENNLQYQWTCLENQLQIHLSIQLNLHVKHEEQNHLQLQPNQLHKKDNSTILHTCHTELGARFVLKQKGNFINTLDFQQNNQLFKLTMAF